MTKKQQKLQIQDEHIRYLQDVAPKNETEFGAIVKRNRAGSVVGARFYIAVNESIPAPSPDHLSSWTTKIEEVTSRVASVLDVNLGKDGYIRTRAVRDTVEYLGTKVWGVDRAYKVSILNSK